MYKFDREAYNRKMEWFVNDRFGMFIHWGIYAIPSRGEWVRSVERISKEEYLRLLMEADTEKRQIRKTRYCLTRTDYHRRTVNPFPNCRLAGYRTLYDQHFKGYILTYSICLFGNSFRDFKQT